MFAPFPILALLAALSPLVTLAWLWQLKEWRWDRLLEHLNREGWLLPLWGRARPLIVLLYAGVLIVSAIRESMLSMIALYVCLLILIGIIAIAPQRRPVFTHKAIMLVSTAFMMDITLAIALTFTFPFALPFLTVIQPLILAAAWLLWYPTDAFLKNRIIAQAKAARELCPGLTVIGVTGSVGKTTTKELLACVLKDLLPSVTPAYVNSEIGVAQWLITTLSPLPPGEWRGVRVMIVEMGAYRKGEIALMSTYVQQTIAVVTHVGTQHIALFGSQENLYDAKAELVTALPPDGRAFLNGDNALCRKMREKSPCPVTMVGTGGSCDLEAFDIEETATGIRFRTGSTVYDVPLAGTHNVTNALLAIAVGQHLGVKPERMRELLKTFTPLSGTFSVREESKVRILDDTHNSSAASVKAAIAWARNQPEKEKILLAAGLIEMGDYQSPAEQELGALASTVFSRIIVINTQSAENFRSGGATVEPFNREVRKIPEKSLLVCTGRMAQSSIRSLLP